jgi:hypothetical protein
MENEIFICECNSPEHQFIISYDGDYFYLTTFLSPYLNFFERCFLSIKYIFGYKSKNGAFDSILISKKRASKLANILSDKIRSSIDYQI